MIIPPINCDDEFTASKMKGYVLFLPFAQGSKSEGVRPYLVNSTVGIQLLYREGDNPFKNEYLRSFHGKYCGISGHRDEGGFFKVDSIEELRDPNLT